MACISINFISRFMLNIQFMQTQASKANKSMKDRKDTYSMQHHGQPKLSLGVCGQKYNL